MKIEVQKSSDATLQSTPLDTTKSFAANTVTDIKTDIAGANITATAPATAGSYRLKLTLSGDGVDTVYLYVYFDVVITPDVWGVYAGALYSMDSASVEVADFDVGEAVHLNFIIMSIYNLTDVTWDTEVLDADYALVEALSTKGAGSYAGGAFLDKQDIFGGASNDVWDSTGHAAGVYIYHIICKDSGGNTLGENWKSFSLKAPPTITSPAITPATITQAQSATVTATISNAERAWVTFLDAAGDIVHTQDMTVTGTSATVTVRGRHLPVGTYAAGQIEIHAIDSTGALAALDATLELEVTAPDASILIRVSEALQGIIRDSEVFSDINDEDIIIAAHPNEVGKVMGQKSIILIPLDQKSEEYTCALDENTLIIWAISIVYDSRTDREDYTPLGDVTAIMEHIKNLVREQDDDPDERLSGLAHSLHATSLGDENMDKRGGTALVGYTEITVIVHTDENGDPQ